jgi:hypothetical protein
LDEVDPGNHFGDGVFDLDARVDLDEVHLLRVNVVEEFDGACVTVVRFASEANGGFAELVANARRKIRGGRDLDHFLMAALDGAVTFVEMEQIAMRVAEDLDFKMTCA